MKMFLTKVAVRLLTFLSMVFLSVFFILEISIEGVIFSLIYLLSGKQFSAGQITMAINEVFSKSDFIE